MSDRRPNIVLITTDTSRTDTLGCYGSSHAVSPHVDRLAVEGALFEQAHTNAPVCMPARCSLLTGTHTPVHGCVENALARRNHLTVFPDLLAKAGYTTILVGKAHFGSVPESLHVRHIFGGEKGADVDDAYARHLAGRGFRRSVAGPGVLPAELSSDAWAVETTIAEIDRVRRDGPFFAHCSLLSPHAPLDPPESWLRRFADTRLPPVIPADGETAELPRQLRDLLGLDDAATVTSPDPAEIDHRRRLYYASAAACDEQIGRLLGYLDDNGLRENTLVIFTSDHGQQYFDHGFDDKHTFYDASWRIPLVLRLPGTIPAGVREEFAMLTDVTATILAAAGVDFPPVQGFDLVGPLYRGQPSPRQCASAVLYKSLALATRRWKLEYYPEEATGRLFDRIRDPNELVDLYSSSRHQRIRHGLLNSLLTWRADLSDIEALQTPTEQGGPVARRAAAMSRAKRGSDAETRLGERATMLDRIEPSAIDDTA